MSTDLAINAATARSAGEVVRFGPFTLNPAQRVLTEADARIALGNRAFDILLLLVERAGTFVSKSEIFARVWPTTVVVEGNLRVHLAALRKALGDGHEGRRHIVTVPNRGYSFIAPVSRFEVDTETAPTALSVPLNRIVGRDAAIESLSRKVRRHRLVTVVGAGGIGKTTLAVSVAAGVSTSPTPWTGVHFVDLAPLADGRLVPGALAAVLGLRAPVDNALPYILAFLHDKSLLLLLDNCEHVLAEVAELAEAVLRSAPGVHILATSREPLKADGERVQQLAPLDLPAAGAAISAAEAMRFGAVELFVDRATATLDTYALQEADVASVVTICRRLDGIPLAIELAASHVSALGVRGIEAALGSNFIQIKPGRRTAVPRHRTMQAMIDWSHGLLSPRERCVLARISLFCGSFTLESAGAVASNALLTPGEVFDAMTELAAKSLVAVDVSGDPAYFRLLETTRCYAARKLAESGEFPELQRRHAEHVLALLGESEQAWGGAEVRAWRERYGRHVDDLRTALDWAMSPKGDAQLGIALTVRSALLMYQLSRADECMRFASAAMEALLRLGTIDPRLEVELHILYALSLAHTRGVLPGTQRSLERAMEVAEEQAEHRLLAMACTANWAGAFIRGDPQAMHGFAQKFETLSAGDTDPAGAVLYDRTKAHTLHLLGDQRSARAFAERALAASTVARQAFLSGVWLERSVTMGMLLTRVLWLQGLPDQAEAMAAHTVETARRDGESLALAYVLGLAAIPLAIWAGRFDLARERVALLMRHTLEHSLAPWRGFATAYGSLLDWHENGRRGHPEPTSAIDGRHHPGLITDLLATLHPAWADERTFQRGEAGQAGWCQAELLRVRAERARAEGRRAEAERLLARSLARAREDGALSWELRTATSLARLWMEQGEQHEARALLRSVLDQFTEGHATADVREAAALHDALTHSLVSPYGSVGQPFVRETRAAGPALSNAPRAADMHAAQGAINASL